MIPAKISQLFYTKRLIYIIIALLHRTNINLTSFYFT